MRAQGRLYVAVTRASAGRPIELDHRIDHRSSSSLHPPHPPLGKGWFVMRSDVYVKEHWWGRLVTALVSDQSINQSIKESVRL